MTERLHRYREKNAVIQAWVPKSVKEAFLEYLKKYSYGDSDTQRFRIFVLEILRLEKEGITIANPRKSKEQEFKDRIAEKFGEVTAAAHICVRLGARFKEYDARDKELACIYCKDRFPAEFKACQELRAEFTSSKEQKEIE
jgi:hypothetical protein